MANSDGAPGASTRSQRFIAMVAAAAAAAAFLAAVEAPVAEAAEADGDIVIVGGAGVVSSGVAAELANCIAGSVERVAGSNRYGTAAAIWRTVTLSELMDNISARVDSKLRRIILNPLLKNVSAVSPSISPACKPLGV